MEREEVTGNLSGRHAPGAVAGRVALLKRLKAQRRGCGVARRDSALTSVMLMRLGGIAGVGTTVP